MSNSRNDQRYTEEVAIVGVGPFGEDDQQIFKELLERTWDAAIVDKLRRFSPGQTRLIRGLKAGRRWRTVLRESDGRTFSCAVSLYPLLHERCLGLFQNWTGMTPQELWAVERQCNKDYIPTGIRQDISGVDYYELQLDVEWLYMTILDPPPLRDEWMQSLLFKTTLDDGDLYKFLMDSLLWTRLDPEKFPINQRDLGTTAKLANFNSNNVVVYSFLRLPPELLLLVIEHFNLATFFHLQETCYSLYTLFSSIQDMVANLRLRTQCPWFLPYGETEQRIWDAEIVESGWRECFPWMCYYRECETKSASMRNRRRMWAIVQQIQALSTELSS
ncbi:SubName: Full=Uncharacterized protein {ECO:0000313/EMBL:CCA67100.1} [Serendipita indica DSM 11827]|uniref:F-box domain-containing protein n=1 Tax=Serendipita indica (strain DSM 11827) TaxID=1109443 RepID=G4T6Y5_SERID|nr:SubName: Full=Uncharacterized protein {ECO:0000313/EMBL:CCA67100.1} [Serendipita indica DSM 11827]CCA67100.1 hypothetical protein PIIN_00934 [Serendipita indica DSM 11827]